MEVAMGEFPLMSFALKYLKFFNKVILHIPKGYYPQCKIIYALINEKITALNPVTKYQSNIIGTQKIINF